MPLLAKVASFWRTLLRPARLDRELDEELRAYLKASLAKKVRAGLAPEAARRAARKAVAGLDPLLPVYETRPLGEYLLAARAAQRFTMLLAATFAGVALLLACVGLYGVIAYSVARRRHEFGVRLALGALPGQVSALVVREGVWLAGLGLALGMPGALLVARLLQAQLFGVTPGDLASYGAAAAVLAVSALLASWVAARRATSAGPLEVLRAE